MASSSPSSPSLALFLYLLSFSLFPLSTHSTNVSFSVELIHRDHPTKSPFFNPSLSPSDRLQSAIQRSISRSHHRFSSKDSIYSPVIPNEFEYLMTLQVGIPPLKIQATVDTGSDLTWAQCQPCRSCYSQKEPIFTPNSSSSYKPIPCKSNPCSLLPSSNCTTRGLCDYRYIYGDRSYTAGTLSSETFTFNSDNVKGKQVSIPDIVFGCSNYAVGTFHKNSGGLAGLGGGPLSLLSQLSSSFSKKFSYCLVPYSGNQNQTSLLKFGDNAVVGKGPDVVTTPIVPGDYSTFYYLSLLTISIGYQKVTVPRPNVGKGNIIIDSGTSLTMLEDNVLRTLIEKVKKVVKYRIVKVNGLDLCFNVVGRGKIRLPELVFGFSGSASVRLRVNNSFIWPTNRIACLAMASSRRAGVPIFGNLAQQNFYIGYDLGGKQVTFAPTDCSKF